MLDTNVQNPHITKVHIKGYKSLRDTVCTFSPNINIVIGENGSGKTNLVEAIEKFLKYKFEVFEFEKMETLYFKIFDGYFYQLITGGNGYNINRDSVFILQPPLVNDDTKLMKEFIGWVKFEAGIYKSQNSIYHIPIKKSAIELLALLKKETSSANDI